MTNNKNLKVIIDTNFWISFLIGKELSKLQGLLVQKIVIPVLFNPIN